MGPRGAEGLGLRISGLGRAAALIEYHDYGPKFPVEVWALGFGFNVWGTSNRPQQDLGNCVGPYTIGVSQAVIFLKGTNDCIISRHGSYPKWGNPQTIFLLWGPQQR